MKIISTYTIKMLEYNDFQPCLELAFKTFDRFKEPDCSECGIESFKRFLFSDQIMQKYQTGNFYMWEIRNNDTLIGMIAIRDQSHICLLFVDGDHHRKGIGTRLFKTALKFIKKTYHSDCITVNATPYGIPFYKSLGFVETDFEKIDDGIRYTPMKLVL